MSRWGHIGIGRRQSGRTFDVQALRRLAATCEIVRVEDNAGREPVVEMVVQLRAASTSEHIIGLWPSRGL